MALKSDGWGLVRGQISGLLKTLVLVTQNALSLPQRRRWMCSVTSTALATGKTIHPPNVIDVI